MKLAWILACALLATPALAADPGVESGVGLYRHGDYAGAVSALKTALEKGVADPSERASARMYLASSYEAQGQIDPARGVLKQLFEADPAIPIDPALFPPSFVKLAEEVRHQAPPASAQSSSAASEEPLSAWKAKHAQPGRELCTWIRSHRTAARLFADWDAHHPGTLRTFAGWMVYHPKLGLDSYMAAHKDAAAFNKLLRSRRPAAAGFVGWVRRNPLAADQLLKHSGGLTWAMRNLGC
jgi:hypothetical protein